MIEPEEPFKVTFVTGVVPDRWARRWRDQAPGRLVMVPVAEEVQLDAVRAGTADMALVRLPVERHGLHAIPLYTEEAVVVCSREHPVAAYDAVSLTDLAEEHLLQDPDAVPRWRDVAREMRERTRHPVPPMTLRELMASVAADAGIAVLPRPVARVHHRKDVAAVPVSDLEGTTVALVWPEASDDPRVEAFIGVVRGRTPRSSRGGVAPTAVPAKPAKPAKPARPAKPVEPAPRRRRGRRR